MNSFRRMIDLLPRPNLSTFSFEVVVHRTHRNWLGLLRITPLHTSNCVALLGQKVQELRYEVIDERINSVHRHRVVYGPIVDTGLWPAESFAPRHLENLPIKQAILLLLDRHIFFQTVVQEEIRKGVELCLHTF